MTFHNVKSCPLNVARKTIPRHLVRFIASRRTRQRIRHYTLPGCVIRVRAVTTLESLDTTRIQHEKPAPCCLRFEAAHTGVRTSRVDSVQDSRSDQRSLLITPAICTAVALTAVATQESPAARYPYWPIHGMSSLHSML